MELLSASHTVAKEFLRRFKEYPLTVIRLSGSETEKEFNLQFARLNLGTIINSGEKLHAMVGELRVDAKIDSVFITWVRWCSSTWAGRCSV